MVLRLPRLNQANQNRDKCSFECPFNSCACCATTILTEWPKETIACKIRDCVPTEAATATLSFEIEERNHIIQSLHTSMEIKEKEIRELKTKIDILLEENRDIGQNVQTVKISNRNKNKRLQEITEQYLLLEQEIEEISKINNVSK